MLIGIDNGVSLGRAWRIGDDSYERVAIDFSCQRGVDVCQPVLQSLGEQLSPQGSRHGISQSRSDVVKGQVETRDDGQVFMLQANLNRCLSGIWEETASNTQNDLSANDTGSARARNSSTVMDEQSESNHEQTSSHDDEDFKTADFVNHYAEEGSDDDADKRVQRRHTGRSGD